MNRQVQIGPEFFAKAKNDYSSWEWALIREFMQNSIDAPRSTRIAVTIRLMDDGDTLLVVENNGAPMDEDTLVNNLLSLGSSGKQFRDGAVGGFGKAKEILYFCHKHYSIETGRYTVQGSGAGYTLHKGDAYKGTRSTVILAGDCADDLRQMVLRFAELAQWKGELTLNGQPLDTSMSKGRPVRDFLWGKVYVSRARSNTILVRIGGIPMFTRYTGADRLVIVELEGASDQVLQSSRDALKFSCQSQLDRLCEEIAVDKRSALKDRSQTTYTVWQGGALGAEAKQDAPQGDFVKLREKVMQGKGKLPSPQKVKGAQPKQAALCKGGEDAEQGERSPLGFQFIVKTNGRKPAKGYTPDAFNSNAQALAVAYANVLLMLWQLFGEKGQFSVGFTFDNDVIAEHVSSNRLGTVFLVNPLLAGGRAKAKWTFDPVNRWDLVAVAAHEFVHHKGFDIHDENYSSYYTTVVEPVLLRYRHEFEECFLHARKPAGK